MAKNSGFDKLDLFADFMDNSVPDDAVIVPRDVGLMREDPNNARRRYDADKLRELGQSIQESGLSTPVCLRTDPDNEGGFLITNGHRRVRAAKLVGIKKLPSYVDDDFDPLRQLADNIQREDIDPLSLAESFSRIVKSGVPAKAIYQKLGKSKVWMSQIMSALDMEEPVREAYAAGRIQSPTVIAELNRAYKRDSEQVRELLDKTEIIGRSEVERLKPVLPPPAPSFEPEKPTEKQKPETDAGNQTADASKKARKAPLRVFVRHKGVLAHISLEDAPASPEMAFIQFENGRRSQVALKDLTLVKIE